MAFTKSAPGGVLKLGPTRSGARCYLCVAGGIEVAPLLGSSSTHILSGLGGFDGRALRKGDQLKIGAHEKPASRSVHVHALQKLAPRKTIRTTIAPQSDWFTAESLSRFYAGVYAVTERIESHGPASARSGTGSAARWPHDIGRGIARRDLGCHPRGSPSFFSSSSRPPAAIQKSPTSFRPISRASQANFARVTKFVSNWSRRRSRTI